MNIPDSVCCTCRPKKKVISPIALISNLSCIMRSKSLHKTSLVEPKIISSTYTCTRRRSPSCSLMKRVQSISPLRKPFSSR
ncbi:hypothetical protein Hanom_Chr11g00997031 [Helianthus anomalus]